MRVAIAGAGAVGRSIAAELVENGHEVLLIDKDSRAIDTDAIPGAEWVLADACEIASLDELGLERCQVSAAFTGPEEGEKALTNQVVEKPCFRDPGTRPAQFQASERSTLHFRVDRPLLPGLAPVHPTRTSLKTGPSRGGCARGDGFRGPHDSGRDAVHDAAVSRAASHDQ